MPTLRHLVSVLRHRVGAHDCARFLNASAGAFNGGGGTLRRHRAGPFGWTKIGIDAPMSAGVPSLFVPLADWFRLRADYAIRRFAPAPDNHRTVGFRLMPQPVGCKIGEEFRAHIVNRFVIGFCLLSELFLGQRRWFKLSIVR